MPAKVLHMRKSNSTCDLEDLLQTIEVMSDSAMMGNHHFLAYLLGMARIEAATLLDERSRRMNQEAGSSSAESAGKEAPT